MRKLIFLGFIFLTSCANMINQTYCGDTLGLKYGTPEYANCMMQMRAQNEQSWQNYQQNQILQKQSLPQLHFVPLQSNTTHVTANCRTVNMGWGGTQTQCY